jgi:predicted RNA-binding Zn ribbon-like protein
MSRDPARSLAPFLGGRLCLDFANTLNWRLTAEPQELLPDYATLLRWSRLGGFLPMAAIDRLEALSVRQPATADSVMREARALRDEICRAATALATHGDGSHGPDLDLTPFNYRLAKLPALPRLVTVAASADRLPGGEAGYVYDLPGRTLEEPLWPILWSWSALLTSLDAARLGSCQGQGCGWFFVDESPNRTRLWCSSELCGNRERARRAYAKRRAATTS